MQENRQYFEQRLHKRRYTDGQKDKHAHWVAVIKKQTNKHQTQTNIQVEQNNKCWQECGELVTFVLGWWECKTVQPL